MSHHMKWQSVGLKIGRCICRLMLDEDEVAFVTFSLHLRNKIVSVQFKDSHPFLLFRQINIFIFMINLSTVYLALVVKS